MNKPKKTYLALKVSLITAIMIIGIYFFMQIVSFFRDNVILNVHSLVDLPRDVFSFMFMYVIPPTVFCWIFLYLRILPLQKVYERLLNGDIIEESARQKAIKQMASFPLFLFGINFFGFVLGFIIIVFMEDGLQGFSTPYRIVTLVSNIGASIIFSSAQASLSNIAFGKLRDLLDIQEIGSNKAQARRCTKQILTVLVLVLYVLTFYKFNAQIFDNYRSLNRKTERLLNQENANRFEIINNYKQALPSVIININNRPHFNIDEMVFFWEESEDRTEKVQWMIFLIFTFYCLVVSFIVIYSILLEISDEMKATKERLKDVVEGEGDLTKRLMIRSFDEYGELSDYINKLLNRFHNITSRIILSASETKHSANLIDKLLQQSENYTNSVESTILDLSQSLEKEALASKEITQALAEVQNATQVVGKAIQEQKLFANSTAAAMEEMTANINSVVTMTNKSESLANSLSASGKEGELATTETEQAISEIEKSSEDVLQVLQILAKISNDTNLLSMNAAIEAAHAGKAGAGFAVVADEVRKLAQNASTQTNIIKNLLETMKDRVDRGVSAAHSSGEALSKLSSGITETSAITYEITQAMTEQGKGTSDVERAINVLVDSTETIAKRMTEQNEKTMQMEALLNQTLTKLSLLSQTSKEQANAMQDMKKALSQVNNESKRNLQASENLVSIVSGLKI